MHIFYISFLGIQSVENKGRIPLYDWELVSYCLYDNAHFEFEFEFKDPHEYEMGPSQRRYSW